MAAQRVGFAAGRVYSLLSFALSIAALILLVLNLPGAIADAGPIGWGWVGFSIAAAGGPTLVSLALSRVVTPKALHVIWSLSAVLLLIAYATVPLSLGTDRLTAAHGLPWLVQLAVLAGSGAALAWPTKWAIGYGLLLQTAIFNLVRYVDESFPGQALGEALGQLFFVTFFTCLAVILRRGGEILDETIESAVAEARESSVAESRRSARQRFEMLLHDRVIAALLSYASGASREQAGLEAQAALDAIAAARTDVALSSHVDALDLVWDLQGVTTQFDPESAFDYDLQSDLRVPTDVASALVQAASEALRNSIRHAPSTRSVTRQVRIDITDSMIEVVVLDDGDGFDSKLVNPARLGIRSGIEGRMRDLIGGGATVSSRLGYGTTVALRWSRS